MFYSFKTQSSSQMQTFFPSSSVSLLASYTSLLIYIQRMRHVVSVHPAMVVNSLQHFRIKICYDFPFKGISSSAQFVTLKIYLWHPSFGCLQIFPKITIKLTLKMGGRVLIATHLDQSNYLANQQQV